MVAVTIYSTRPLAMPRIFHGKPPQEVVALLPMIYSICGTAQGCAAAEAAEQATGEPPPAWRYNGRRLLVALEIAKEHLWRIQLDWARYLGMPPQPQLVTGASGLMKALREALLGQAGSLLAQPGGSAGSAPRVAQLLELVGRPVEHAPFVGRRNNEHAHVELGGQFDRGPVGLIDVVPMQVDVIEAALGLVIERVEDGWQ